jgi:transglutaminase-like putative cysteine protease
MYEHWMWARSFGLIGKPFWRSFIRKTADTRQYHFFPYPPLICLENYLAPTYFLDSDHPAVVSFVRQQTERAVTPTEKAVALFYAVRDGFRYDPYDIVLRRGALKASFLLTKTHGYCIEKAVLLAAAARCAGIPSRLGFVDVRNHIATEKLQAHLGTDVLAFHGYAELFLEGRWVQATPAFNLGLCQRLGVASLEFDGKNDAVFQEFDAQQGVFMEYLTEHGTFDDMPYEQFVRVLGRHYPHLIGPAEQYLDLE